MGGRLWREEDLKFMDRNLRRGLPYVAKELNRTEVAVYQKAQSLGYDVHPDDMSTRTRKKEYNRINKSARDRYDKRKNEGLCTRCGVRWAEATGTKCRPCRERDQKWYRDNNTREYLYDYKKQQKAERKQNNQCINCGCPLEAHEIGVNTSCAKCRAKAMERTTVQRIRMRIHGIKRKR